jgi:putative restriction endonuclease
VRLEDLVEDTRERATRTIALRRGQPQFRNDLLDAYDNTCAVTGTAVVDVLEAAHISPHRGAHTNVVSNGILLRADIHTLFDLYLLTISADLHVRVSPALAGSPYMDLDQRPLASLPRRTSQQPSADCLEAHRSECPWFLHQPVART